MPKLTHAIRLHAPVPAVKRVQDGQRAALHCEQCTEHHDGDEHYFCVLDLEKTFTTRGDGQREVQNACESAK